MVVKAGDPCPNCLIGVLKVFDRIAPASPEPDVLVYLHERGYRCGACGHEGGFETLGPEGRSAAEIFGARCDFCGEPDPITEFPCGDFKVDGHDYVGAFAACVPCRDLVNAGDREGLLSRSISNFTARNPVTTTQMVMSGQIPGRQARRIQAGFWKHRQ